MEVEDDIANIKRVLDCIKARNSESKTNGYSLVIDDADKTASKETNEVIFSQINANRLTLLQECQRHNEMCQRLLSSVEERLVLLLAESKAEAVNVQESIDAAAQASKSPTYNTLRSTFVFGSPYFKDSSLFPCPPNKVALEKRALGYVSNMGYLPNNTHVWTTDDKKLLDDTIRDCEIKKSVEKINRRMEYTKKQIQESDDAVEISKLKEELEECKLNISTVKHSTLAVLVGSKLEEYDWLKISLVDLKENHTSDECRNMWFNYLHPQINKNPWTKDEDAKLKDLAKRNNYQDWDTIAKELGTNRSCYQCMCHFQMRLNHTSIQKWTEDEDRQLEDLIKKYQVENFIPWDKITWYMNGRSKTQVYHRWCYSLCSDIKKGRFTKDEDILIVAGVRKFGLEYGLLSKYFPGRTSVQIRQRLKTLMEGNRSSRWTENDDKLLLDLIKKHGTSNWKLVNKHFKTRSGSQIKSRYSILKRWSEKNPGSVPRLVSRECKSDARSMEEILHDVQMLLKKTKLSKMLDKDCNPQLRGDAFIELQETLKGKKVVGRKLGQKKVITPLDVHFINYFRCAYSQRGGKARSTCSSRLVPGFSQQTNLMLYLMRANLTLPSDSNAILRDDSLVTADKCVLKFLIENKSTVAPAKTDLEKTKNTANKNFSSNEGFDTTPNGSAVPEGDTIDEIQPEFLTPVEQTPSSSSVNEHHRPLCRDVVYMCPPSFTTLVGFRTLLLSRRSLKNELRSLGSQSDTNSSVAVGALSKSKSIQCSVVKDEVQKAERLWSERLASLFTWPALMSNICPKDEQYLFSDIDVKSACSNTGRTKGASNSSDESSEELEEFKEEEEEAHTPNKAKRRKTEPVQGVEGKFPTISVQRRSYGTKPVRKYERNVSKKKS